MFLRRDLFCCSPLPSPPFHHHHRRRRRRRRNRSYVAACKVCCSVIDVAFVVDSSAKSQGQSAWTQMTSFVNLVLDRLTVTQYALRVSFVSYGDRASVQFRFSEFNDRQSAKLRISGISYLGHAGNNLANALEVLRNQVFQTNAGARSLAPWVAVIVTDRSPSLRVTETVSAANQARAAGIQIIPVGVIIPRQLDSNILNQIAFTRARMTTVNDHSRLSGVAVQVADWICKSYLSKCLYCIHNLLTKSLRYRIAMVVLLKLRLPTIFYIDENEDAANLCRLRRFPANTVCTKVTNINVNGF